MPLGFRAEHEVSRGLDFGEFFSESLALKYRFLYGGTGTVQKCRVIRHELPGSQFQTIPTDPFVTPVPVPGSSSTLGVTLYHFGCCTGNRTFNLVMFSWGFHLKVYR